MNSILTIALKTSFEKRIQVVFLKGSRMKCRVIRRTLDVFYNTCTSIMKRFSKR
jgi:hypothetical protein